MDEQATKEQREAEEKARRVEYEKELKRDAFHAYRGTASSFEQDWPHIRAVLLGDAVRRSLEGARAAVDAEYRSSF